MTPSKAELRSRRCLQTLPSSSHLGPSKLTLGFLSSPTTVAGQKGKKNHPGYTIKIKTFFFSSLFEKKKDEENSLPPAWFIYENSQSPFFPKASHLPHSPAFGSISSQRYFIYIAKIARIAPCGTSHSPGPLGSGAADDVIPLQVSCLALTGEVLSPPFPGSLCPP